MREEGIKSCEMRMCVYSSVYITLLKTDLLSNVVPAVHARRGLIKKTKALPMKSASRLWRQLSE